MYTTVWETFTHLAGHMYNKIISERIRARQKKLAFSLDFVGLHGGEPYDPSGLLSLSGKSVRFGPRRVASPTTAWDAERPRQPKFR